MKIEQYINDDGEFRCFGFSNTFFHKNDVKEFVESLSDSKITYFTKAYGAEDFCEFIYKGERFIVSEPYGDNSYFDILCERPDTQALNEVYQRFCKMSGSGKPEKSNKYRLSMWALFIIIIMVLLSATSS
jgi:hypothetical protein